jgi:Ala-tRNA(Pro) deacylase
MDRSREILQALDGLGIPYSLFQHDPKWTIGDCLATPGLDPAAATVPKNVFLCNRQQTAFYLLLLSPVRAFKTAVISKLLGVSRLSFAPEMLLPKLLGLDKGAVSPLGLLFDTEKQVRLVMDDSLLHYEHLWFHPGINTKSIEISAQDFLRRFLPGIGRDCILMTIPQEEGV